MASHNLETAPSQQQRALKNTPLAWFTGMVVVVGRRLWSNLSLVLAIAAGFMVAVAVVVSIPVYAEAVGYRILREELTSTLNGTKRPPFAFMYRYLGTITGFVTTEDLKQVDTYFAEELPNRLDLDILNQTRYIATDKIPLKLSADGGGQPLSWISLAYADNLADHIYILDGRMPTDTGDESIEVILAAEFAFGLGLQPGETYYVFAQREAPEISMIPVRVVGIWEPNDPLDDYWFYSPDVLKETLFTTETAFSQQIQTANPEPINVALWYLVADGSVVQSSEVPAFGARIDRATADANKILEGMRLDVSPIDAMIRHITRVRQLTATLTIFSVPVLGLIAYFVILVAGLVVQRQSNEIAVLRSRGASRFQIMGIYLIEWITIGAVALSIGVLVGQLAAVFMTWTKSFLEFSPVESLPISMSQDAWMRAIQIVGLMLTAALLPAFFTSRFTIVSFKSERARMSHKPFWQRAYLDILLMIPIAYGWWMLKQQGSLGSINGEGINDPFNNPLLLIAPSLYIFVAALIGVRLFPIVMRILEFVAGRLPGIAAVTALRYLARTPSAYAGPILLLIVTLSLAGFTASMAKSLDNNLLERNRYVAGGDARLFDLGQSLSSASAGAPGSMQSGVSGAVVSTNDRLTGPKYFFLPIEDYASIDGVAAATRVSSGPVSVNINSKTSDVHFYAIDRIDFPKVAYWREDFADQSLGYLMNVLAEDPSGVLVDKTFARAQNLRIGDTFFVRMNNLDATVNVPVVVKGFINLFPTAYPSEGPPIVGNLEYAFDMQGGLYPYDVWLRLAPDSTVSDADLYRGTIERGMKTFVREFAPSIINKERLRPERQGFFGLLSVGFVAAGFLSMLGFLFYSILAFQRRFVELGMLRAIGLSTGQLGTLLAIEQTFIIGLSILLGTFIGVSASHLFIPFLQLPQKEQDFFPPFAVTIATEQILIIYAVFGFVLIATVLITVILLRRMKLFQAVKLGEAV
jgi:putative ABC transport system permease protein